MSVIIKTMTCRYSWTLSKSHYSVDHTFHLNEDWANGSILDLPACFLLLCARLRALMINQIRWFCVAFSQFRAIRPRRTVQCSAFKEMYRISASYDSNKSKVRAYWCIYGLCLNSTQFLVPSFQANWDSILHQKTPRYLHKRIKCINIK